ncbi:MAG: T9SS type A sorting domain-containing protein, partial [Bacteroidia bacterium]|nr:T9SS type A sorting domain-containing protein [Bacteroidia bacterium]
IKSHWLGYVGEQVQKKSVPQEQSEFYQKFKLTKESEWDSLNFVLTGHKVATKSNTQKLSAGGCTLNKRVYGWHPYWVGTVYNNYDWSMLSDLCYFSYDVSPSTGNNTNGSFAWTTSGAVTTAIANGVNAHICATMFSGHSTFWASSTAQQTFITNVITLVQNRGGKGVNVDFEGMGASDKVPFTAFMTNLCNQMHAAIPGSEVSIALYAVDWSGTFDVPALNNVCDYFIFMGYDYYYSGSSTAGPESPLYNFQTSYNYTISKTITYYINQGMTPAKLLTGLPYYGREWETNAGTVPSATTGGFTSSRTYNVVRDNLSGYYNSVQREPNSFTNYYSFQVGGLWRQCWIDDDETLKYKYDIINQRGTGGIGIWALGYDDGYTELWDAIRDRFSSCAVVPCTDTIWDMGGPLRNYYNNENYTTTISPPGASSVQLAFSQFDVELNFDTLWIYDGTSTASPLIGSYTGTNSPGTVASTQGNITIRFKSDGGTVNPGYTAIWSCMADNVVPTTSVSAPTPWVTQNFTANFTDADNGGGSGIEKSFYQVLDYNGTEWRANNTHGFFSDNFDLAIHPDWTSASGVWGISGGYLQQTDEANTNTNIYAPLTQNLSNRYLYQWSGNIDGAGTNRRAGIHFFCDSAQYANRKNSYFIWYRVDQDQVQFYKVVNDVFTLENTISYTLNPNQWYDNKVTYDRISGQIQIWIDNNYVGSWTDPSPYSNGNYISFRSGNCIYTVNDLKVYRSRAATAAISVGTGNANDIRFENTNPSTPSAKIKSITKDNANNLSAISFQDLNVDWTKPLINGVVVSDGITTDIDTSASATTLAGNWIAFTDTNSAIAQYEYAIGSTPGAQDAKVWTVNGGATIMASNSLSLLNNQLYYISVRATDGAGLVSDSVVSDGVLILTTLGVNEWNLNTGVLVYPNPSSGKVTVKFSLEKDEKIQSLQLINSLGQMIALSPSLISFEKNYYSFEIDPATLNLAAGVYHIKLNFGRTERVVKLILQN